jgi:RNA polymerase sigma-70 factor (ECF subfamily)
MTHAPPRHALPFAAATDAALVERSIVDPRAFEQLFERHARAIFVFAAARVGPQHAEDVTSETFATAFRRRASFDPASTSARPWLYGIAANKLLRHHEAERRWLERQSLQPIDGADDPEGQVGDRADALRVAPRLTRALAALTPGERDVLLMHVLEDLTHAQIALALDIRRGTAKSRLSRGLARLRAALDPNFDPSTNATPEGDS